MKKGITKILSACVFAFVVFLAAGTQSKAAVNMGVKQTGAGSSYVDLDGMPSLEPDTTIHSLARMEKTGSIWNTVHHQVIRYII